MTRTPNPFLVVALLVSVFMHLFLVDRAIDLTLKWRLFSTSTGDQLFRIRDVDIRQTPRIPLGKPRLSPDELITFLGSSQNEAAADLENEDTEQLLKTEKFLASDVPEETLLETIEKAIEAEQIAKTAETPALPVAEEMIAQEVLAIDEAMVKESIPSRRPRIIKNVKRGTATSDIISFFPTTEFTEPLPTPTGAKTPGETTGPVSPDKKDEIVRVAMAEQAMTIPGVIAPPPAIIEREIESADLVDIVTDDYEKIRKYPPLDDLLTVRLFTYHRPGETRGYFRLAVQPRGDKKDVRIIPKDIIFVVDSSKSITQKKLNYYVEGLKLCLRSLNPRDRFNIVEFKSFTRKLAEKDVVPVTPEMIARAETFLSGLISEGATDVYKSLTQLVTVKPTPGRPRVIFLVSDGRPTTGIRKNREIINEVTRLNNLYASIFTFAGGEKINTSLLDLLSYRNRGSQRFETNDRRIPDALFRFYVEFSSPILMNPRFNFGSLDSTEVYPKILPDLYLSTGLEMFGRFEGEKEFSMQLLGEADGQTKEYVLQQGLTGKDNGAERIAQQWGHRKIYYLEGQVVLKGESQQILSLIQKLSADYSVQTSYRR